MMKTCKACGITKDTAEFYPLPHTSDGLNWRCIHCQNEYNRAHSLKRALAKCHPAVLKAFSAAPIERLRKFAPKVAFTKTCWLWRGNKHPDSGYARIWFDRHDDRLAHRVAFEWARGAIPDGLVLDHICRVRHCVNPDHLEPVTSGENVLRGISASAINARKTHCLRGHEFTRENTWTSRRGERHCRECTRARKRLYRQAVKALRASL